MGAGRRFSLAAAVAALMPRLSAGVRVPLDSKEFVGPRLPFAMLNRGYPPDMFGVSPQCRRLVRKNRMRRLGIGADHR